MITKILEALNNPKEKIANCYLLYNSSLHNQSGGYYTNRIMSLLPEKAEGWLFFGQKKSKRQILQELKSSKVIIKVPRYLFKKYFTVNYTKSFDCYIALK